jgi:hypothetical protein
MAALAAGVGMLALAGTANAATMTFAGGPPGGAPYDEAGFRVDDARIVNGNCDSAVFGGSGPSCMAINKNENSSTVTNILGLEFTLDSFWYELLGNPNENVQLTVTLKNGSTTVATLFYDSPKGGNGAVASGLAVYGLLTSVKFDNTGEGNVRIDDIGLTPVPVPGAALLFGTALAGVGFMSRRKKAANAA